MVSRQNRPPPIREIVFRKLPKDPPLHRWSDGIDDISTSLEMDDLSASSSIALDPFLAEESSPKRNRGARLSLTSASTNLSSSAPSKPVRRKSNTKESQPKQEPKEEKPSFLSPNFACPPRRKPPKKSAGFHEQPSFDLPNIALKPIKFIETKAESKGGRESTSNTRKEVAEGMSSCLQSVVGPSQMEQSDKDITVLFAIRRPGCGMCRDHGLRLAGLVHDKPNVNLIGVIKQTGVDDAALMEFYTDYFNFPLYKDEKWDLFINTCGDRKISLWRLITLSPRLEFRYAKKNIRNIPFGGDIFTQGGVLIFDKQGKLRFVYYETYGKDLDLEAIGWAIEEARKSPQADTAPSKPARR